MPRVCVISQNGQVAEAAITGLASMQSIVGGYIEAVALPVGTLYCNEDGIARGLPPNAVATAYAQAELAKVDRELYGTPGRPARILGTVFVTGPCDDEGEATDCPDAVFAAARALAG